MKGKNKTEEALPKMISVYRMNNTIDDANEIADSVLVTDVIKRLQQLLEDNPDIVDMTINLYADDSWIGIDIHGERLETPDEVKSRLKAAKDQEAQLLIRKKKAIADEKILYETLKKKYESKT